jgi:hypothetical protein
MGEEARGRSFDEGEMKRVGRWFGSTPAGCGRAMDDGAWSGGKPGSGGSVGGGRRPRVDQAGPNGRITRAGKEKFWEKEKKINGPPGNFGPDCFWAALRKRKRFLDFDSRNDIQIKILNISKPILNWIFKIR